MVASAGGDVGSTKVVAFLIAGSEVTGGAEVGPATGVSNGFSSADIF